MKGGYGSHRGGAMPMIQKLRNVILSGAGIRGPLMIERHLTSIPLPQLLRFVSDEKLP